MRKRSLAVRLLSLGVLAACCGYLVTGLDIAVVSAALTAHPVWFYPAAGGLFAVATLPMCLRFHLLAERRCSLAWAAHAAFIGSGINNLAPARLGDLAKAGCLTANCRIPFAVTLCAVFWERLADLAAVSLLAVTLSFSLDAGAVYLPPLCLLAGIGAGLFLIRRRPEALYRLIAALPARAARPQLAAIVARLAERDRWPAPGGLCLFSALVWASFCLFNTAFIAFFFGSPADMRLGALVTAAGAVGMMAPGLPAHLGSFEASTVAALTLAGHDKSEALALAVILHLVQMAPSTLYTGYAVLRGQKLLPDAGMAAPERSRVAAN